MTVTVAPQNDNNQSEYLSLALYCFEPKSRNHDVAIDSILQELEEIQKGKWCYYAYKDRWIYTSFNFIVYLSDRPKRADMTHTLTHYMLPVLQMRLCVHPVMLVSK